MDDKVFASATMTAAMTDNPSEYESIPTVDVFDTDQGNDLIGKQAGENGTGLLRALQIRRVRHMAECELLALLCGAGERLSREIEGLLDPPSSVTGVL